MVYGEMVQISLVQDRVQWWAVVDILMNFYIV
jgi:hypothetical protein